MYKVFIYDKPLYITSDDDFTIKNYQQFSDFNIEKVLKHLQNDEFEGVIVKSKDLTSTWEDFTSHFIFIEAAGGVVLNSKNDYLFIHRLGKWDLPKGKLEYGENIKECAIREVEEECNVSGLNIISELPSTYHCYPHHQGWALKQTYWFKMTTDFKGSLIPQTSEGIEKVVWLNQSEFNLVFENTYLSIKEVLNSI